MKVNDNVRVKVLNYNLQGVIVELNDNEAVVQVPVYYGKHNQEYVTMTVEVNELEPVFVSLEDMMKYKKSR